MHDTTIIALAGLVATALSPLVTGRVQRGADRDRLQGERADRDLDERRDLIDNAAHEVATYIEAVTGATARASFTETWDPETFNKTADPLIEAKAAVYRLNRRLVIRLGRTSPVVVAFGVALKQCDKDSADAIQLARYEGPAAPAEERIAFSFAREPRIAARWEAYEAFLDAGTALVGASPDEPASAGMFRSTGGRIALLKRRLQS